MYHVCVFCITLDSLPLAMCAKSWTNFQAHFRLNMICLYFREGKCCLVKKKKKKKKRQRHVIPWLHSSPERQHKNYLLFWKLISSIILLELGFLGGSVGKESACNAGDTGSVPELGRSPGRGYGNTLQYSCQENPHEQWSLGGYNP